MKKFITILLLSITFAANAQKHKATFKDSVDNRIKQIEILQNAINDLDTYNSNMDLYIQMDSGYRVQFFPKLLKSYKSMMLSTNKADSVIQIVNDKGTIHHISTEL